jgi:hypothetical protein
VGLRTRLAVDSLLLPKYGLRLTNPADTDAGPKPSWTDYAGRSAAAPQLPLPVVR